MENEYNMDAERVEFSVERVGIKYQLISKPGRSKAIKEDRIYFIRLTQGDMVIEWLIKHDEQIEIMKRVINNDVVPRRFIESWTKFDKALKELWDGRFPTK